MLDDMSYIPNTISIMSKVKSYLPSEHSLSRIIQQQALDYRQQIPDEDIVFNRPNNMDKKGQSSQKEYNFYLQRPKENGKKHKLKKSVLKDAEPVLTNRISPNKQRKDVKVKEVQCEQDIRMTERKVNLLIFEDLDQPVDEYISNKQKRTINQIFEEQKTKKIDFQHTERYNQPRSSKKNPELTKIKQKTEGQYHYHLQVPSCRQGVLNLVSKQSSDMQFEEREMSILTHQTTSNYNILIDQVRQIMSMTRWQYIQLEKIELRKLVTKAETDIRKIKIGFRGLSESSEYLYKSSSKLRIKDSINNRSPLKKVEESKQKDKKGLTHHKNQLSTQYGFDDFQRQLSKSFVSQSSLKTKMQQLQAEIDKLRKKQLKMKIKLNELTSKHAKMKKNSYLSCDFNPTPSMINHRQILKEKVAFLKTQVKQTKAYFSHRIKRLRNQNGLLKNQISFSDKEMEQIKKCIRNIERSSRNYNSGRQHKIMRKDEQIRSREKSDDYNLNKIKKQGKQKSTAVVSNELKSIKSINSMNSINSIQSFNSKPSVGSINSYKSAKVQSQARGEDLQFSGKPKLKINSPHIPVIPSSVKGFQSVIKRKKQTESRFGLKYSERKEKKQSSLDMAFQQLKVKYEVHLHQQGQENEYYTRGF